MTTTAPHNAAARYLEDAKIEDLSRQLRRQGYDVEIPSPGSDTSFDLVATKSDRTIVFEVKASPTDPANVEDIARRRATAFAQGFDEFRLVVVNPPHETRVDIPGLEDQLRAFLDARGGGMPVYWEGAVRTRIGRPARFDARQGRESD